MTWAEVYEKIEDIETLKLELKRLEVSKKQFANNKKTVLNLTNRITFLMLLIMDKERKIVN